MRSAEGFSGRSEGTDARDLRLGERETWTSAVQATQTGGTRLELPRKIGPRVSRIAVLAAELVDLNVDVIVVTGFQARKKVPAMNVRRSTAVRANALGAIIPSKPWTQFCDPRIEPSVGERLDAEPPGGLAPGRLR
jgi:hypothetical protein